MGIPPSAMQEKCFGTVTQKLPKETQIKVFRSYLSLLDFSIFLKIFSAGLSLETFANSQVTLSPSNFNILTFFVT